MRWLLRPEKFVVAVLLSQFIGSLISSVAVAENLPSLHLAKTRVTITDYAEVTTLDFIEKSEFIVLGEIHTKEVIDAGPLASIITEYDVHILGHIRGFKQVSSIRVSHIGGEIGDTKHVVSPAFPEIEIGEQVILLLQKPDDVGRYRLSFFRVFKVIEAIDSRPFVEPLPTGMQIYTIDGDPIDIGEGILFLDEFIYSIKKLN